MHRHTAQPFSLDFRASFGKAARVGEEIIKCGEGKDAKKRRHSFRRLAATPPSVREAEMHLQNEKTLLY